MYKRSRSVIFLAAVAAIISFSIARVIYPQMIAKTGFIEYTIVYDYFTDNGQVTTEDTVAIRQDGSRITMSRTPLSTFPGERGIIDANRGFNVSIDSLTKTFLRMPLSAKRLAFYQSVPSSCDSAIHHDSADAVTCEGLSTESLLGRAVVKAVVRHTDTNGATTNTEYLLDPLLNWLTLERTISVVPNGHIFHMRAKVLQIGHPDDSLFAIPEGYSEAELPSKYLSLFRSARNLREIPKDKGGQDRFPIRCCDQGWPKRGLLTYQDAPWTS